MFPFKRIPDVPLRYSAMIRPKPILYLSAILSIQVLTANDVTSWRNGGNGLYPDANPATNWNDPSAILWEVEAADWGNAAPLIIGNRLLYTAEPTALICLDAATGQQLWEVSNSYEDVANLGPEAKTRLIRAKRQKGMLEIELKPLRESLYKVNRRYQRDKDNAALRDQVRAVRKEIATLEAKADPILKRFELPKAHATNGYASFTPCSDGEYIYNCNGLGIITKHDLDGNRVWSKVMEKPDHNWGGSVSPQLIGGKLIVRFSDYTALDPETGEELWRVENLINFGTPSAFQVEGRSFLYTGRGELIRVSDGKKLPSQDWVIPEKKFAFFNTNFVSGNHVYAVHGAKGLQGDLYCMEIPATIAELEANGLQKVWHTNVSQERYYASPLEHEGLVYIFTMGQIFQVLEADTGELVYSHKIPGRMDRTFPGLLLVNDMIYAGEENGTAFFLKPGREYEELARLDVGECRSTPIFKDDVAYLRTMEKVFAFKAR